MPTQPHRGMRKSMADDLCCSESVNRRLSVGISMVTVLSVADVVLLQKWLLAVPNTDLPNWKAADLCEDDKLDVFDLCMMKRALLSKET